MAAADPDPAPTPATPRPAHRVRRARRARDRWRSWRHSRPFWGGLLVVIGGVEILASERAPIRLIVHFGVGGLAGLLVPTIIVICGLLLWFNPQQRLFYSIMTVVMSLISWATSNLGGFLIGMVLGLIGGSLAFGWTVRPRATGSTGATAG